MDIELADGRTIVAFDSGAGDRAVLWQHESPSTGVLLEPLLRASAARGIRLFSYARPSYGGSTPNPGRTVGDAALDAAQVADALGIGRFAVLGGSGGGSHALACAALLPERVTAVISVAGVAPFTDAFDWFDGMVAPGGLRAALEGRTARATFAETDEFEEASFIAADWEALAGEWRALGADAGASDAFGPDGLIDDDVALVTEWGCDLGDIEVPALLVQGGRDRVVPPAHASFLASTMPRAELWERPGDGHISALLAVPDALDWLLAEKMDRA